MSNFFTLQLNQQPSRNVSRSFLEKYKKFLQGISFFVFQVLQITSWNIRICLSLGQESSISRNIRRFFRVGFVFIFGARKIPFPEIWESSISWNIEKFFGASVSQNMRKVFFWDNIINFWEVSVPWNTRTALFWEIRVDFFYFLSLDRKMGLVAVCYTTLIIWKHSKHAKLRHLFGGGTKWNLSNPLGN